MTFTHSPVITNPATQKEKCFFHIKWMRMKMHYMALFTHCI